MPIYILSKAIEFPLASLADDDGLLAIGGDLKAERLIEAYSKGIFPWFSEGDPILWFSPNPRMLLYPKNFKCSNSLDRIIKSSKFEIRVGTDFEAVIRACKSTRRHGQGGTWITKDMVTAYVEMHRRGIAHSFETYQDDRLVGGLYGLSIGAVFFGESMFHSEPNASKVAFAQLVSFSQLHGFHFIDAQTPSHHLQSLGAENVDRSRFLSELSIALKSKSITGTWTL